MQVTMFPPASRPTTYPVVTEMSIKYCYSYWEVFGWGFEDGQRVNVIWKHFDTAAELLCYLGV